MSTHDTDRTWTVGDLVTEFDAEDLLLVNPNQATVKTMVASRFDSASPRLRILAEEHVVKGARRHFASLPRLPISTTTISS